MTAVDPGVPPFDPGIAPLGPAFRSPDAGLPPADAGARSVDAGVPPVVTAAGGWPSGGAWLRVLLAFALAGTFAMAWIPTPLAALQFGQIGVMALVGLWVVAQPGSAVVLVALAGVFAARIFAGSARLDLPLVGLTLLVPLVHQLAALAAVVPPRSTVRGAALLHTAVRYVGSVLMAVLILIVAALTVTPLR